MVAVRVACALTLVCGASALSTTPGALGRASPVMSLALPPSGKVKAQVPKMGLAQVLNPFDWSVERMTRPNKVEGADLYRMIGIAPDADYEEVRAPPQKKTHPLLVAAACASPTAQRRRAAPPTHPRPRTRSRRRPLLWPSSMRTTRSGRSKSRWPATRSSSCACGRQPRASCRCRASRWCGHRWTRRVTRRRGAFRCPIGRGA